MKRQLQQLPLIRHLIYPSDCAKCFISTLSVSVHTNLWREYKDSSDQQEEMPPSTHTYSHTNAHTLIHTCTHSHTLTHSYTPSHKCTHMHTFAHTLTHSHTRLHTHPARLGTGTAAPLKVQAGFPVLNLALSASASSTQCFCHHF